MTEPTGVAWARRALLAAPLLLCVFCLWDGSTSWLYFGRETGSLVLALAGLVGVLAGVMLAVAGKRSPALARTLRDCALLFWSVTILVGSAEVVLRLRAPREPMLRQPGLTSLRPDLRVFPGASEVVRFTTDDVGLRGPAWPNDNQTYKIVTVGGSTTENDYMDDRVDWSRLVMDEMNQTPGKRPVWVANAGINGHTAVHHLTLLRALPLFKRIDAAIILVGVNDLNAALAYGGAPTQEALEQNAETFRQGLTGFTAEQARPLYRRSRFYQLLRSALLRIVSRAGLQRNAVFFDARNQTRARELYASLPVVPLPDLDHAILEYRSRLEALAAECRALHIRCVFLTQPSLWREDLDPADRKLLCCSLVGHQTAPLGWTPDGAAGGRPRGRLALRDSAAAMLRYNTVLLETCARLGVDCLDLASVIPRNAVMFFDDFHFTEAGSRRVGHAIAGYLNSQSPFAATR
jgi:lysophospholipase L1-like esterase